MRLHIKCISAGRQINTGNIDSINGMYSSGRCLDGIGQAIFQSSFQPYFTVRKQGG